MRAADFLQKEAQKDELGEEIYFPTWKCFCCADTGFVRPRDFYQGDILTHLASRNIPIACACNAGLAKGEGVVRFEEVNFDTTLAIHHRNRQAWTDAAQHKVEIAQQAKEAIAKLNLQLPKEKSEVAKLSLTEIAAIESTLTPAPVATIPPDDDMPF